MTNESEEWSADLEVDLLQSMEGHKPCGINRHFHMICIQQSYFEKTDINISTSVLWDKLNSLWDLSILDAAQDPPFPSVKEKGLFSLPFDTVDLIDDVVSSEDSSSEMSTVRTNKKQKSPVPSVNKKRKG